MSLAKFVLPENLLEALSDAAMDYIGATSELW